MWDCAMQKHEVYRVAILKALIFLASKVDCKLLRLLYQKVKQTPLGHIDKFIMGLLKAVAKSIAQQIDGGEKKNVLSRKYELLMGGSSEKKV